MTTTATYHPRRMTHEEKHDVCMDALACAGLHSHEMLSRVAAAVCHTSLCLPEADSDGKRGRVDMVICG